MPLKLLIAEDDRDLAEVVAYGARQAWPDCRITIAADGMITIVSPCRFRYQPGPALPFGAASSLSSSASWLSCSQ